MPFGEFIVFSYNLVSWSRNPEQQRSAPSFLSSNQHSLSGTKLGPLEAGHCTDSRAPFIALRGRRLMWPRGPRTSSPHGSQSWAHMSVSRSTYHLDWSRLFPWKDGSPLRAQTMKYSSFSPKAWAMPGTQIIMLTAGREEGEMARRNGPYVSPCISLSIEQVAPWLTYSPNTACGVWILCFWFLPACPHSTAFPLPSCPHHTHLLPSQSI